MKAGLQPGFLEEGLHVVSQASALLFEIGPLVSLLLRTPPSKQVQLQLCEFVHGGRAQNVHVSFLRRCDERTHVNTRVYKLLFQELESSQVFLLVMSPRLLFYRPQYLLSQKFQVSWLSKCIHHSQKLDAILRESYSYYGSASIPKWPQKQSQSI